MDKEKFVLDARVVDVLSARAFRAELRNGHRLVAFVSASEAETAGRIARGSAVDVECSPFDLSKARVVRVRNGDFDESP
jgi:translation initiation factor IF-1